MVSIGELGVNQLARRLYETMERLDPDEAEFVCWSALPERDRHFYRACVGDLLDHLSDYDVILRSAEGGKEPDI